MSTHKWTDTDSAPDALKEGMLACEPYRAPVSAVAEAAIRAGLLVQAGTADPQVKALAALPAADADAIAGLTTDLATAATAQVFSGSDFDGAIGAGKIFPARSLTFTLNSHADWDATVMRVHGLDADGNRISEEIDVPDAGNTTLYSANAYSQVLYVELPAQSGTNGSFDIGLTPAKALALSTKDCGVAIYDRAREPSATSTVTFDDEETLSVLHAGQIAVIVEAEVVKGDRVGVRVVESGTDLRGQFSKMPSEAPASLAFAPLNGAVFKTAASAGGVAIVEIGG